MEEHFCSCPDTKCGKHPANHVRGCDPCVKSNLAQKSMPTCFFKAVHADVSAVTDYTSEGFVEFFLAHREEYLAGKKT